MNYGKIIVMKTLKNLQTRQFNTNIHTAWVNEEDATATFPLWNLTGQMVGFQQYRPFIDKTKANHPRDSRYFTYRKNRVIGVWGLESWKFSNTLFVTEGVFDACRLTNLGYSAIATLSNDVDDSLKRWLWTVRKYRRVVTVCDNDAAGRRLAKYGHVSHVVEGGDLGAASEDYVRNFLEEYA